MAIPLKSRTLDSIYFIFFAQHLMATLLMDLQAVYPSSLVPTFMSELSKLYLVKSNDPLIGHALGFLNAGSYSWFKCFLYLEGFFQVPVFILGMRGLWKGSRTIYVLLLVYGASSATTTMACVAEILNTPLTSPETIAANIVSISPAQRTFLLSSYIPFLILPLLITLDMSLRVSHLVRKGIEAQAIAKAQ